MPQKTVYVELVAKTQKLQNGMKKVDRQVNKTNALFKKLGVTLVGVFGARALFRGFQNTLKQTNALIKTAKGVGFATAEYQQLVFALNQVGVSAGSAKIALGDFQKRLSKAVAGSSPQFAKAFADAGLDVKSLSRMSPAAAFTAALDHLSTLVGDPRLAGLTGNVFEEQSGKDILQVLRDFEKYKKARLDFSRQVPTLTQQEEAAVTKLQEKVDLLTAQFDGLSMKVVSEVAPDISAALEEISESGGLKSLTEGLGELIKEFNKLVQTIVWVADAVDKIGIPDWAKKLIARPGGFSPQGALSAAFDIADVLPNFGNVNAAAPGDLSAFKGTKGSSATVNKQMGTMIQNNTIVVKDGDQAKATRRLMEKERRAQ